jgi:mycothiol synthase
VSDSAPPAGHTARAPKLTDAEAIWQLVAAYNTAIVGFADCTVDDVRDELSEPGWDPDRDGWLAFDASGRLTGYGWASAHGDDGLVDVDLLATEPAVADWLLDRAVERAREMGRERGVPEVRLDKGIYRDDHPMRARLEARGFAPSTTFQRMRIDHADVVARPEPPAGLTVREATDDAIRRAAHEVHMTSFADHYGFATKTYDEWVKIQEAKSTFDWPQLWLAELDGSPVGLCLRTDQFVEDEDCGYIGVLGVVPAARGHGVASYLLRRAFADDATAGRTGTILHVDANNTTPALGLYEGVGMRSVLIVDMWRHTLPV